MIVPTTSSNPAGLPSAADSGATDDVEPQRLDQVAVIPAEGRLVPPERQTGRTPAVEPEKYLARLSGSEESEVHGHVFGPGATVAIDDETPGGSWTAGRF